jgi:hypothetical protein
VTQAIEIECEYRQEKAKLEKKADERLTQLLGLTASDGQLADTTTKV